MPLSFCLTITSTPLAANAFLKSAKVGFLLAAAILYQPSIFADALALTLHSVQTSVRGISTLVYCKKRLL